MTFEEIYIGQETAGVTAQPVTLSYQMHKSATIKALSTNTGIVYVGGPSVTAAAGFPLAAGESVTLETVVSKIKIIADAAGQGYSYLLI